MSTKELAKETRKELKKRFKNFKFSVTSDYNSITVAVMEADINMMPTYQHGDNYAQLNHFYLDEEYKAGSKQLEVVKFIYNFISKSQREVSHDGDYGSIPNYYINIWIGKWNKPFKVVKK